MKKQLKKPNLHCAVKNALMLGTVTLAVDENCSTSGTKSTTQSCKGAKCCNGAGGC